ncbi:hypothetical protein GGP69_002780 [Salinibacter ruber]|nr:hypothetical protein [Salinibacter ruber]MCS4102797.1 hypothetical protein [Salinibacter ruber]MCS4223807.1 hypothetical protein [Salinibacter ruber]
MPQPQKTPDTVVYVPLSFRKGRAVGAFLLHARAVVKDGLLAFLGGSLSAFFGQGLLRATPDPVAILPETKVERHFRRFLRRREVAPHLISVPLASRGFSVERKANRVKQGGLARSSRPVDEEELLGLQLLEIDGLRAGVRSKLVQFETLWGHRRSRSGRKNMTRET